MRHNCFCRDPMTHRKGKSDTIAKAKVTHRKSSCDPIAYAEAIAPRMQKRQPKPPHCDRDRNAIPPKPLTRTSTATASGCDHRSYGLNVGTSYGKNSLYTHTPTQFS